MTDPETSVTPTQPAAPDLEALRDEKVIPVARGVLVDMAGEISSTDVNEDTDFTSILVKILRRGLAADLNLVTDNPYVFQLILGSYSAFSSIIQKCKFSEAQDIRYSNIGRELMGILSSTDVPMGTKVTAKEQEAAFEAVQDQIQAIVDREKLTWLEMKYIMEGLFRSLKSTEQLYNNNVDLSVKRMEAKILGLEDITDLTMSKLDATLQAEFVEAGV